MTPGLAPKTSQDTKRLRYFPVLDALRFVLALWVAISHLGMIPLFGDPNSGTGAWLLLRRGWNTTVFGTPAVIVFFVVSGFCIHLPFRGISQIDVPRFYLRRYTRILIPVAGALVIYRLFGERLILWGEHSVLWHSPLWSLLCEEIYYAFYPLIRWLGSRFGWSKVIPLSFVISVPVSALHPHAGDWHVYGPFGTALILLPVWLLGCLLAEQSEALLESAPHFSIWFWRFLAWSGCWVSEMLHFKLKFSYTLTMAWFGVLAYFWVRQEIIHAKTHPPNRFLVAAGGWSYSLYLVHSQGATLYEWTHLPSLGLLPDWLFMMTSSLVFAYCFYLLVERPSHRLARKVKFQIKPPTPDVQPAVVGAGHS
jgi:peptidoglycan/LPS O-acetylase OafA/YrhL